MNNQNRMAKDNIYKLLEGTNYIKNPDKLDEYRDTKNKMFGTVNWFELETMSLNQFLKPLSRAFLHFFAKYFLKLSSI